MTSDKPVGIIQIISQNLWNVFICWTQISRLLLHLFLLNNRWKRHKNFS